MKPNYEKYLWGDGREYVYKHMWMRSVSHSWNDAKSYENIKKDIRYDPDYVFLKLRAKRNYRNLPNPYDDIIIDSTKSWKKYKKVRKQWMK